MIVWGWGGKARDKGPVAPMRCPNCSNTTVFHWVHTNRNFKLYWVPIVPYDSKDFLLCPLCQAGMQFDRLKLPHVEAMQQATRNLELGSLSRTAYQERVASFWTLLLDMAPSPASQRVEPPPSLPNSEQIVQNEPGSAHHADHADDPALPSTPSEDAAEPVPTFRVETNMTPENKGGQAAKMSLPSTSRAGRESEVEVHSESVNREPSLAPSPALHEWLSLIGELAVADVASRESGDAEPVERRDDSRIGEPIDARKAVPGTEHHPCPACGEPIRVAAIKCRWCEKWLDGREGRR